MKRFRNTIISAGLTASLAAALGLMTTTALADGAHGMKREAPKEEPKAEAMPEEMKTVKIDTGYGNAAHQSLHLAYGRAAIVELPVNVRDVLVANPGAVESVLRSPRQVYIMGAAPGANTNVVFFDAAGKQILNLDVHVGFDTHALHNLFSRYIPGSGIKAEALNGSLVLSGQVASPAEADRAVLLARQWMASASGANAEPSIVNLMSIAGPEQVMLKVRIVEMQRTLLKQLGFNFAAAGFLGDTAFSVIQNNGGFSLDDGGNLVSGLTSGTNVATSYTDTDGGLRSLDTAIKALETLGLVRTLAEPNLTAISGEQADFLAGGEVPVLSTLDQNGNAIIEYKPFGVSLGFTPTVLSAGRIAMKLSTEVSDVGATTGDNPTFTTRRANTAVELPSGSSLVIAGILQSRLEQTMNGMPGVKDIPVLGALFRSKDYQQSETELAIIVTPYLVNPTHPNKVVSPTDGYQAADDAETLLMGKLNKVYKDGETAPDWQGPAGQSY